MEDANRMRIGALVGLLLVLSEPAAAQALPAREVRLPNGLTVVMADDSDATTVDVAAWYPAGTRSERSGATGITRLVETLMLGGSKHVAAGEHQRLLQAEGATLGSFTAPDYTCFYETVPPVALDLALRLEADRMGFLDLTPRSLEAARRVLREEQRSVAERGPVARGVARLYETAFPDHPYRWPTTGLDADLGRIRLRDCIAYYRERYAPDHALLTIVGRFDPDSALAAVRRCFGPLPRRASTSRAAPPGLAPQTAPRRAQGVLDARLPLLLVGWRTSGAADPDAPALDLLMQWLTRGQPSPLQRALIEDEKLCLQTQGAFDLRREAGLFYVCAVVRPEADSAAVERRLLDVVEGLGGQTLLDEDVDALKRQAEAGFQFGWQTSRARAQSIGAARMLNDDPHAVDRMLDPLRHLTPDDLQKSAARVLSAEHRSVVWMRPAGPQPALPAPGSRPAPGAPPTPPKPPGPRPGQP